MESVIVASAMIEPRSPFEMESSADSSQGSTVLQINFNHDANADGLPESTNKSRITEESSDEDRKATEVLDTLKCNSSEISNNASYEQKFMLDIESKESPVSSQQQQQQQHLSIPENISVNGGKGPDSESLKPHRTVPTSRPAVTIPIANGLVEKFPIRNAPRVLSSLESPNEWIGGEIDLNEKSENNASQFSSVAVTDNDSLRTDSANDGASVKNTCISSNALSVDCATKDIVTEQLLSTTENSDSDRNLFITMTRMKEASSVATSLVFKNSSCKKDALRNVALSEISHATGASISPGTVANMVVSSSNADECIAPFRGHVHHIPEAEDSVIAMQSASSKTKVVGGTPARPRSSSRSDSAYSLRSTASIKATTKARGQTKRPPAAADKAEKKLSMEVKSKSKLPTDLKPSKLESDDKDEKKVVSTTAVVEPIKTATDVKCEAMRQAQTDDHITKSPNDGKIVEISEIKDESEMNNKPSINVKVEESIVAEPSITGPGCPLGGVSFIPAFTAKKATKCGNKTKSSRGIKANKTPCSSSASTISTTSPSMACTASVSTTIISATTASITTPSVTMVPVTMASITTATVTTSTVTTTASATTTSPLTTFATMASVMAAFAPTKTGTTIAAGMAATPTKPRRPAKVRVNRDKTASVRRSSSSTPTSVVHATTPEGEVKEMTDASQTPAEAPSPIKVDGTLSPPKKPLTPYMKFSKSIWAKSRSLHQTTKNVCEVGSNIGRLWRELPDAEKQLFIDDFTVDKRRYDNEVQAYLKRTGLQISDLPKIIKARRRLSEQKRRIPGSRQSKASRVAAAAAALLPPGSAAAVPPGSAPAMPHSVAPLMPPLSSDQVESTISPVHPPAFAFSSDSPNLTNDQVAEQMARSFLESAGINGDSIQQQQQQQPYQNVGVNNDGTTIIDNGYHAICVDANGCQTMNGTEDRGYQINGNGYQAVGISDDIYQTGVPNGNEVYQSNLVAGDGYQTGLGNEEGYQTGLENRDGYQTGAVNGECYQTGAINADGYQADGEGGNIDGGYQTVVAVNGNEYETVGSTSDQTNGQFYQWARQQMYDQNGGQQMVSQIYSNTANQNDDVDNKISSDQSQQVMGLGNVAMAAMYRDSNRGGQAMMPSEGAPSTVDSTWLWNQLNTAVTADQFIPTGNPSQQQDIQYNHTHAVSGNVGGVGSGGGGGMLIYQLSADGSIDPLSGVMSSVGDGVLEVGEVPGDEQLNNAQQNQTTDLSSRDTTTNGSMLYQLSLYGNDNGGETTGDGYRQWAAGCQMNNGETSNPVVVVDVEKQQLRSALVEKGKECERLVAELHQAYLLIHQLKQQNDIYQRHWTTQAVVAGDGCDGNSNAEMNVGRVGDNTNGGELSGGGGGS